jgi:hypothetical protein
VKEAPYIGRSRGAQLILGIQKDIS